MASTITVNNRTITIIQIEQEDYICLTDMIENPAQVLLNWLRGRETIKFLGLWEQLNNADSFNSNKFNEYVQESAERTFTMSPSKWISGTNAVGLLVKRGRTGGVYAHKDIALEFCTWLSPAFKLYLIREFQRLKEQEKLQGPSDWDVKRMMAKANYGIHTDAVKKHRISPSMPKNTQGIMYASEADILNRALFGITAAEWRRKNPLKAGNIRDYASVEQLLVLGNLEAMSAQLMEMGWQPQERLDALHAAALSQLRILMSNSAIQRLAQGKVDGKVPPLELPASED
jgi:hypothetical protein